MPNYVYWSKTALTGGGATALDGIATVTAGDICHVCISGVLYVYKAITSSATESSPDIIAPDAGGTCRWQLQRTYSALPTGYISGLAISNGTDTDHDLNIAAGKCRDDTDAVDMVLGTAITAKAIDTAGNWTAGSTQRGLITGETVSATDTLHVWLIMNPTTGVVDVMMNSHATSALAPTPPTGYTYKRRIGSMRIASSHIVNGDWWGTGNRRIFILDTPISDASGTCSASAADVSLSVPNGIQVMAKVQLQLKYVSGYTVSYVYSKSSAVVAAAGSAIASVAVSAHTQGHNAMLDILTNTSGQIAWDSDGTGSTYEFGTFGWEEAL